MQFCKLPAQEKERTDNERTVDRQTQKVEKDRQADRANERKIERKKDGQKQRRETGRKNIMGDNEKKTLTNLR